ncbi:S-layer homology domain-containing protein [Paenibacillus sp. 2TAB26]|uniref:S-layer homology domain-containing protein n=1 Tax=Paenibacillus sp. 2TAB26 TaxID=3233005 RepID=UPI003F97B407
MRKLVNMVLALTLFLGGVFGSLSGGSLVSAAESLNLVSLGLPPEVTLNGTFDKRITSYTATVPNSYKVITIAPIAESASSSVKLIGSPVFETPYDYTGPAIGALSKYLNVGVTRLSIDVINGSQKQTYTIDVKREIGPDSDLITHKVPSQIGASASVTYFINGEGKLFGLGDNNNLELGSQPSRDVLIPVYTGLKDVVGITGGISNGVGYAIAMLSGGRVAGLGKNVNQKAFSEMEGVIDTDGKVFKYRDGSVSIANANGVYRTLFEGNVRDVVTVSGAMAIMEDGSVRVYTDINKYKVLTGITNAVKLLKISSSDALILTSDNELYRWYFNSAQNAYIHERIPGYFKDMAAGGGKADTNANLGLATVLQSFSDTYSTMFNYGYSTSDWGKDIVSFDAGNNNAFYVNNKNELWGVGTTTHGELGLKSTDAYALVIPKTRKIVDDIYSYTTVDSGPWSPPISAPTNLAVKVTSSSADLSWNAVPDVTGYQIKRNGSLLTTVTGTSFKDTNLTANTKYDYVVAAVKDTNVGKPSTISATTLSLLVAPANFDGSDITGSSITMSWSSVVGADEYVLKRNDTIVAKDAALSFVDSGLTLNTSYTYSVVALLDGKEISEKAIKTLSTLNKLDAVTNFRSTSKSNNSITLGWNSVPGASSYEIFVGNGTTPIYVGNATSFAHNNLISNTVYEYHIIAKKTGLISQETNLSVATDLMIIPAPAKITVTGATYNSASFNWTPVDDAEIYVITRNGNQIASGISTSYTDTGLEEQVIYTYRVVAKIGNSAGAYAEAMIVTPVKPNPEDLIPQMPSADVVQFKANSAGITTSSISLFWNTITSADTYTVKRDGVTVHTGSATTFTDTGLEADHTYIYTLTASNVYGESASVSTEATTKTLAPAKVENLRVARIYSDAASMQWGMVPGAKSYTLVRDGDIIVYSGPATTFRDTTLSPTQSYEYKVIASNDGGSSVSDSLTVTTIAEVAPVAISPAPAVEGTVTFTFRVIETASAYYVERNPQWVYTRQADGTFKLTYTNTSTGVVEDHGTVTPVNGKLPFAEYGVAGGANYHYDVTAVVTNPDGSETSIGKSEVEVVTPADGSGAVVAPENVNGGNGGFETSTPTTPTTPPVTPTNPPVSPTPTPTVPTPTPTPGGDTGSSGGSNGESGEGINFPDTKGHWSEEAVLELSKLGVVSGDGKGNFNPNAKITRAEFTAMVVRALTSIEVKTDQIYSDVIPASWYFGVVNTGTKLGFVTGIGGGLFKPHATVTRQEMATILSRVLLEYDESLGVDGRKVNDILTKFIDSNKISMWAWYGTAVMLENKLLSGINEDILAPRKEGTRAEAAVLIYRSLLMIKNKAIIG